MRTMRNRLRFATPPVSRLFEGVKVTLTAGANKDQFTYSDDRGLFTFNGLSAGTHTLSINHAGYQPWTQTVNLTENVTNLSVVLYPAPAPTAMPPGPLCSWSNPAGRG